MTGFCVGKSHEAPIRHPSSGLPSIQSGVLDRLTSGTRPGPKLSEVDGIREQTQDDPCPQMVRSLRFIGSEGWFSPVTPHHVLVSMIRFTSFQDWSDWTYARKPPAKRSDSSQASPGCARSAELRPRGRRVLRRRQAAALKNSLKAAANRSRSNWNCGDRGVSVLASPNLELLESWINR